MTAPSHEAELIREVIRREAGTWFEMYGVIWPKIRSEGRMMGMKAKEIALEQGEQVHPSKLLLNYLQDLVASVLLRFLKLGLPVRLIVLKPRQKGSTTWFAAIDYWIMRFLSTSACVIGGEYEQTKSIWTILQNYLLNDKFDGWGNTGIIDEEKGKFSHGSTLKKETARDRQAGVSGTFQLVHATEVARWAAKGISNGAEVLSNLLKCVPLVAKSFVILESTAEGDAGDYPERWKSAVDMDDFLSGRVKPTPGQYVRIFAPWFEFADSAMTERLTPAEKLRIEQTLDADVEYAGEEGNREAELIAAYGQRGEDGVMRLGSGRDTAHLDVWEQLAWRRYAIHEECKRDPDVFDQDYPHCWEVAFLKSGRPRFLARGVREMKKRAGSRTPEYGLLDDTREDLTYPAWRMVSASEGVYVRWEDRQPGFFYSVIIDTMTGISQVAGKDPDCHSVTVRRNGYWRPNSQGGKEWVRPAIVARIRPPCRWDIDVLEKAVWRLACYYGGGFGCRIVIEMNADRGLTELLKQRGAVLYERKIFNQREQRETNALGWMTTPANREGIVDAVARLVREWDKPGEGIDIWDEYMLNELANFIRKDSGRSEAAEGWHDDDVLGLGIGELTKDSATPCSDAPSAPRGSTDRILKKDGFHVMRDMGRMGGRKRW